MVLVIIGLTVSGVMGIALSMMKSAEIKKSASQVNQLKEKIIGFALTNQRLPQYVSGVTGDESMFFNSDNRDFWGQRLVYIYDPQLTSQSVICGSKSTRITARNCSDTTCDSGGSNTEQANIAFVIFSRGANLINQTAIANTVYSEVSPDPSFSGSVSGTNTSPTVIKLTPLGTSVGPYNDRGNDMSANDDLVAVVSLDELRQKLACQGAPLRILNTELPMGASNTPYSASIYTDGGVGVQQPSPPTGKLYWCTESTVDTTISAIAKPQTVVVGRSPEVQDFTIGASGSCLVGSTAWVQGDSIRLVGTGASNALATTAAGAYDITVYVRDNQSGSNSATYISADNTTSKRFVLAINGS